jgi:hypothetical protein
VVEVGWILLPFVIVGPVLALAYNLELFGGFVHTDIGFALAWGAFPVLTAYAAQADSLDVAALTAAVGATALSLAQRWLSTPARLLRRRVARVEGTLELDDGTVRPLTRAVLLRPMELALQAMSVAIIAVAVALIFARFT